MDQPKPTTSTKSLRHRRRAKEQQPNGNIAPRARNAEGRRTRSGRSRFGIKTRLTALVALVLIGGALALLGSYNFLVQRLLWTGTTRVVSAVFVQPETELTLEGLGYVTVIGEPDGTCPDGHLVSITSETDGPASFVCLPPDTSWGGAHITLDDFAYDVATQLVTDVTHQLEGWTVVIFLSFVALAIGAAWLVADRSLGRVGEIITTTRAIDPSDLSGRLRLGGPDDEVRELGDTIDGMLDRIQEGFERQERFVSGASHELRTPLATTRALLEIPLAQGLVPELIEPDIRDALAATIRSEQLVAALLTLAQSGRSVLAPTTMDLASIGAELVSEWEPAAVEKGGMLKAELAEAPALVNPELVLLAARNLVSNAVQHGSGDRIVIVQTGADGETAWLQVTNDGADLTGVDLEKLKEPFYRGDQSRLAGTGLGLGLALADSAAKACGGELTLTARPLPQGGLTARLTLPGLTPE
ncbi:MAG: ATP-binding protein [Promicromonosporaceae bacterium]|nr:ATP-binding protein [Promicromonosporaceae bacterium]